MSTTYRITSSTYRDREGFLISGGRIRIFALTRPGAERIRDAYKKADEILDTPGMLRCERDIVRASRDAITSSVLLAGE